MTDAPFPRTGSAAVHVLHEGYAREDADGDRVGSTVTLILDAGRVIVVDPGMVPDRGELIAALAGHGPGPGDVTDVVFSHHHPDHTVNAALFPAAKIHDHWATYDGDLWTGRDPGDFALTPSVWLPWPPRPPASARAPTPGGARTARPRTRWPPRARRCGAAGRVSSPPRP